MTDEGPAYEITPYTHPDDGGCWRWTCRQCGTSGGLALLADVPYWANRHVTSEHPALPPIPTGEGTVIRHRSSGFLYQRLGGAWMGIRVPVSLEPVPTRATFDVAEWS